MPVWLLCNEFRYSSDITPLFVFLVLMFSTEGLHSMFSGFEPSAWHVNTTLLPTTPLLLMDFSLKRAGTADGSPWKNAR